MASKTPSGKSPSRKSPGHAPTRKTSKKSPTAKSVKSFPPKKSEPASVPVEVVANTPEAVLGEVTKLTLRVATEVVTLKVVDEPSLQNANQLLVEFAAAKKMLEEKRKFFLGPMKESLKRLEAQFKVPAQRLFDADRELRNKVVMYLEAKSASVATRREAFVQQAETAAAKGDSVTALAAATSAVTVAEAPKTMMVTGGGSVQTKEVDDFEVTDYGAIPPEYFTLDEKKIRAAISSGRTDIPGVRIFKRKLLAVGG